MTDNPKTKKGRTSRPTIPTQETSTDVNDNTLLVTLKRAGQMMGLSERTIWSLCHSGKLRKAKIGRSIRVVVASIHEFIEGAST